MSSILSNFEYDIFISYRQKDNKGEHWVTNFVSALKTELDATFKEDISIYFDENPHDGLLPNHDVDDSLREKLRCLIFIPIISQTYCDKKSFAWESEFVAFKKMAIDDKLGLKLKLSNGNVASRILPICIHELDDTDKQLVEAELGGMLRGIEFIYKTAGVVRPLKAQEEDSRANLNHTFYSDQINKVARACKDLITGIQSVNSSTTKLSDPKPEIKPNTKKRLGLVAALICLLGLLSFAFYYFGGFGKQFGKEEDHSIAVIPFENMNKDPEQDYFSNGIAEDILNHLTKVSDLKVKSRTSTLQYKGTTKTVSEIGEELNVSNVVEGSVRRVGDKVRIVVQLIDAKTDNHLWSETYDRDFKDVLALQSEIAIEIANALNARLTASEKELISKEVTKDVTAYDFYLQARDRINRVSFNKEQVAGVMELTNKAIELDPTFSKAYALKANLWFYLSNFGLPQHTWEDSAFLNAEKSIRLDAESSDAYLVKGRINWFLGNLSSAKENFKIAYRLNPKDLDVQTVYGYLMLVEGDEHGADMVIKSIERNYSTKQTEFYESLFTPLVLTEDYEGAVKMLKEAIKLNPGSDGNYYNLVHIYRSMGLLDESLLIAEQELKISPGSQTAIDNVAWCFFMKKDYKKAAEYWSKYVEVEASFEDKTQTVPFRHRLAMALLKLGDKKKARELLLEDTKIQTQMLEKSRGTGAWNGKAGNYYDLAVDKGLLGFDQPAIQYLDSAVKYGFRAKTLYENDPAFENIKDLPEFRKVQGKLDAYYAFRKKAFTNAFNRAKASNELKNILK